MLRADPARGGDGQQDPARRRSASANFLLLYKELDADDGELTRTRKVRRGVIDEKYGTIIDAIYCGDRASIDVDTTIAFQDGTRQRIRTVSEGGRSGAGRCGAGLSEAGGVMEIALQFRGELG